MLPRTIFLCYANAFILATSDAINDLLYGLSRPNSLNQAWNYPQPNYLNANSVFGNTDRRQIGSQDQYAQNKNKYYDSASSNDPLSYDSRNHDSRNYDPRQRQIDQSYNGGQYNGRSYNDASYNGGSGVGGSYNAGSYGGGAGLGVQRQPTYGSGSGQGRSSQSSSSLDRPYGENAGQLSQYRDQPSQSRDQQSQSRDRSQSYDRQPSINRQPSMERQRQDQSYDRPADQSSGRRGSQWSQSQGGPTDRLISDFGRASQSQNRQSPSRASQSQSSQSREGRPISREGGSSSSKQLNGGLSTAGRGGKAKSPLYSYGFYTDKDPMPRRGKAATKYFGTTAYAKFVYSLGHPWCYEGFGDAFTMAVTQLLKSEVSVMLSNTAAGLDSNRSELLFDADRNAFGVVNRTGQYIPGLRNTAAANISFPHDAPRNAVTWPVLMGIVSKLFDDSRVGQKLRSVTDLLCQLSDAEAAVQPLDDNVYFCFMEDLVGSLLICGESEQAVDCKEFMSEYSVTREDFPDAECRLNQTSLYYPAVPHSFKILDPTLRLPILFVDLLKSTKSKLLPRKVPESIVYEESLSYLLLFRGLMIISSFSRVPYLCGADKIRPPTLYPGWDLPFVITTNEEGDPIWKETGLTRDAIPIIFISQSKDQPCAFVIAVRGTATMFEWTADFEYGQAPFGLDGRIQAHKGFLDMMNVYAPVIEDFLRQTSAAKQCTCENTHLIFTGHSLGAGVSQLLALYFAEKYGILRCGVDVSGAFFAPPRVFNYAGSQRFRQIVNGRVVLDIGDGLSYMPCYDGNSESGWPRCARGHMTTPGEGRDFYADNYALVEIEVNFVDRSGGKGIDAFMQSIFPSGERNRPSTLASLLSKLFGATIPGLNQVPSLGVLGAAHVCAFACKFSQDACGSHFQWWCDECPMLL